jgi:cytochrome P450
LDAGGHIDERGHEFDVEPGAPGERDRVVDVRAQPDGETGLVRAAAAVRDDPKALTEDRRANPREDLASVIANAEIDGEPIVRSGKLVV